MQFEASQTSLHQSHCHIQLQEEHLRLSMRNLCIAHRPLSISCHVFYNCTYLFHPHYEGPRILLGLSILLTLLFLHSYTFLMLLLLCSTSRCILAMTVNCLSFFSTLFCYIYIHREGFTTEREGGHRQADRNLMTISLLSVSKV